MTRTTGRVVTTSLARSARPTPVGSVGRTGIAKEPAEEGIVVTVDGVAEDTICNTRYHGGPDKAVYAYAVEDLRWWEATLGRSLPPGFIGENLLLEGIDVTGAVIGEQWTVGVVQLEVTMPRIPCVTFQHHIGERQWLRRFTEAGRPGAYLRVLLPGRIRPEDPVVVAHRPDHGVTLGRWFTQRRPDDALRLLAAAEEGLRLAPFLREHVEAAASRQAT